jgi:anti-sigma B factor antagonist
MPLQISQKEVEGIFVVALKGRLVLGDEAASLQDEVSHLLEAQHTKVIFDLKEVPYVDSTGLGVLVVAHTTFGKSDGGALKLLHVSERHMELLILTKLSTIFEIFDDEQAAIDSFFPERTIKRFDILEFVKSQEDADGTKSAAEDKKAEQKSAEAASRDTDQS